MGNPFDNSKRSAQNSKNTKFFLGSNNNCNTGYGYPSNNYNTYPSNNYNTGCNSCGSSNNYNSGGGCRCTSLTWTDHYGNVNGNRRSSDHGKGSWCYTTGWSSGCG